MILNALAVVMMPALVGLLIIAATGYFVRFELPRPPIGSFGWSDIAVMSAVVIIAPFGYLALPRVVVAVLFGLVVLVAIQLTLAPLLRARVASVVSVGWCGAIGLAAIFGQATLTAWLSGAALIVALIGVTNLWAQGGMRASHVAVFAGLLAGYDLLATCLSSVMSRFATELRGLPFAPMIAVSGGPRPTAIGLGDLLILALFPLVATKAFGRAAGVLAGVVGVAAVAVMVALFRLDLVGRTVPVLTILGPMIIAQYGPWRLLKRHERAIWEWRAGLSATARETDPLASLESALALIPTRQFIEGTWLAVQDGLVVGSGASPGLALRMARRHGHAGVLLARQA